MGEVCKKAIVRGHVQGVGFRYTTIVQAKRCGEISGWAKNCHDGSVEVVMRGEDDAVTSLIEWLHKGPDSSFVESVEVMDMPHIEMEGFNIC